MKSNAARSSPAVDKFESLVDGPQILYKPSNFTIQCIFEWPEHMRHPPQTYAGSSLRLSWTGKFFHLTKSETDLPSSN